MTRSSAATIARQTAAPQCAPNRRRPACSPSPAPHSSTRAAHAKTRREGHTSLREHSGHLVSIIVLGLDNAGWHTAPNLVVPDGIRLVYLPRYSPELQPAEHLWPVLDEPLANQYFETLADLERAIADRCRVLDGDPLSLGTNFHWWPKPAKPA